jgi:copper chaperone CopZ
MRPISKIMAVMMLLVSLVYTAQIKNAKTETVKISGNCDMCKSKIEKSGNVKNVATVNWDEASKMATLTYDSSKTNQQEILKRIANAGYDSESFYAPDDVYAKLPSCCQYKRNKATTKDGHGHDHSVMKDSMSNEQDHSSMSDHSSLTQESKPVGSPLQSIQNSYLLLKNALVRSDAKTASANAKELTDAITAVKMNELSATEHDVWMKVMNILGTDAKAISQTQDVKKQREAFKSLSKNMYELLKTSKHSAPIYYQYCPMQDANWLSTESTIKNPYYGAQMLTCGSTVETLK